MILIMEKFARQKAEISICIYNRFIFCFYYVNCQMTDFELKEIVLFTVVKIFLSINIVLGCVQKAVYYVRVFGRQL